MRTRFVALEHHGCQLLRWLRETDKLDREPIIGWRVENDPASEWPPEAIGPRGSKTHLDHPTLDVMCATELPDGRVVASDGEWSSAEDWRQHCRACAANYAARELP